MDGKGPTSLFKLFLSDHSATPTMCIVVCSVVMMMVCEYPCPKTLIPLRYYTQCVCVCVRARACVCTNAVGACATIKLA